MRADAETIGDAANELGVTDFLEKRSRGRERLYVLVAHERRAPQLHVVHPFRLVGVGTEDDDGAVREETEPVTGEGIVHFLPDHVVREQNRAPGLALVERVQHILAVGRADAAQKLHPLDLAFKRFGVSALQIVAARENDAVVFGKLDTGLTDRIDAIDLLGPGC